MNMKEKWMTIITRDNTMKLTNAQLKQIIMEELQDVLEEGFFGDHWHRTKRIAKRLARPWTNRPELKKIPPPEERERNDSLTDLVDLDPESAAMADELYASLGLDYEDAEEDDPAYSEQVFQHRNPETIYLLPHAQKLIEHGWKSVVENGGFLASHGLPFFEEELQADVWIDDSGPRRIKMIRKLSKQTKDHAFYLNQYFAPDKRIDKGGWELERKEAEEMFMITLRGLLQKKDENETYMFFNSAGANPQDEEDFVGEVERVWEVLREKTEQGTQ